MMQQDHDYIWRDPNTDGWIDAWNGWYTTEEEARSDAQPAVTEHRPWVLEYGEGLIGQDEFEARLARLDPDVPEADVMAAVLTIFPDAELAADDDGQLVINTGVMWSGKNGDMLLGNMNIGAGEGKCWRCGTDITSRVEVVWLDTAERNDCPESEDGAPHEKDAP